MEAKDPHILAAMDGKEVNTQNSQPISTADTHREPALGSYRCYLKRSGCFYLDRQFN